MDIHGKQNCPETERKTELKDSIWEENKKSRQTITQLFWLNLSRNANQDRKERRWTFCRIQKQMNWGIYRIDS